MKLDVDYLWDSAHRKITFQPKVRPRVTAQKFAKLIRPPEMRHKKRKGERYIKKQIK
jgi:hypothetical protein